MRYFLLWEDFLRLEERPEERDVRILDFFPNG